MHLARLKILLEFPNEFTLLEIYRVYIQVQVENDNETWSGLRGWTGHYYPIDATRCVDLSESLFVRGGGLREPLQGIADGSLLRGQQDIFWEATN